MNSSSKLDFIVSEFYGLVLLRGSALLDLFTSEEEFLRDDLFRGDGLLGDLLLRGDLLPPTSEALFLRDALFRGDGLLGDLLLRGDLLLLGDPLRGDLFRGDD